jgi:hypothetical protein
MKIVQERPLLCGHVSLTVQINEKPKRVESFHLWVMKKFPAGQTEVKWRLFVRRICRTQ